MSIYKSVNELEKEGKAGALAMIISSRGSTPRHTGSKMLVYENGSFIGTVGGGEIENRVIAEARQSMEDGHSRLLHYNMSDPSLGDPGICGGQVEVYVEPILPKPAVVVIGGGHVGKAVAHLAKWLNFRVIVSDDRPEFCTPEANPDADEFVCCPMEEIPSNLNITSQMYLILTTRGMNVDVPGLPPLLDSRAAYIGVIGSERRWLMSRKGMLDAGLEEEKLNKVNSPIGLEIQAETPEEIAVSILAEIIMQRNGGTGQSMKARK